MEFSLYNIDKNKYEQSVNGVIRHSLSLDVKLMLARKMMWETHGIHVVFNDHYDLKTTLPKQYTKTEGGYTGISFGTNKYDYYELSYKPTYPSLTESSDINKANIKLKNILRYLRVNSQGNAPIVYNPYVFSTSGGYNLNGEFFIKVGIVQVESVDPIIAKHHEEEIKKKWYDKLINLFD